MSWVEALQCDAMIEIGTVAVPCPAVVDPEGSEYGNWARVTRDGFGIDYCPRHYPRLNIKDPA